MSLHNKENWKLKSKMPKEWERYLPTLSLRRAIDAEYTRN